VILPTGLITSYFGEDGVIVYASVPFPLSSFVVYSCQTLKLTWRLGTFLQPCCDSDARQKLYALEPYPIPAGMAEKVGKQTGLVQADRCTTQAGEWRKCKLRQARAACCDAEPNPQVLNLVNQPGAPALNLPFLVLTLVTLPGGHLNRWIFQTVLKRDRLHTLGCPGQD